MEDLANTMDCAENQKTLLPLLREVFIATEFEAKIKGSLMPVQDAAIRIRVTKKWLSQFPVWRDDVPVFAICAQCSRDLKVGDYHDDSGESFLFCCRSCSLEM